MVSDYILNTSQFMNQYCWKKGKLNGWPVNYIGKTKLFSYSKMVTTPIHLQYMFEMCTKKLERQCDILSRDLALVGPQITNTLDSVNDHTNNNISIVLTMCQVVIIYLAYYQVQGALQLLSH